VFSSLRGLTINDHQPAAVREGAHIMDELVGRLVAEVGIDRAVAEKAVGIILAFLLKEGPADKVQALIASMPGAEAAAAAEADAGGGMFGMGGIMGVGTQLMSAGLSMSEVQAVARILLAYAKEKAGEDTVGEVVGAIPGLGQFV
jgi:hypothetical protein